MKNQKSIIGVLNSIVDKRANHEALHHYGSDEDERLSYQQLYLEVQKLASVLKEKIQPGDRVLILLQPGMNYILSFLACIYNGAVAVPCPQPVNSVLATKILNIMADCKPSLVLIDSNLDLNTDKQSADISNYQYLLSEIARHNIFSVDKAALIQPYTAIEPIHHSIAFLQYTSGSTSFPKGVLNLHTNVLHNLNLICRHLQFYNSPCQMGSWLPPYHDMGLIGMILCALLSGSTLHFMSPYMFMRYPKTWLQMISDHRIRYSAAPNFGYAYCVEKIKESQVADFDLSEWKMAICGAEFIHKKTYEAFVEKFVLAGFKKTAFTPAYGLAEATVFVSTGDVMHPPDFKNISHNGFDKEVACCGRPPMDMLIVNPGTQEILGESQEGEILLNSASISPGYWNDTTQAGTSLFHDINGTKYLRTGDLGVVENEQLYVLGRIKELIIINGVNHYPTDFENSIITNIEALTQGRVVAFAEEQDNKEHLSIALANLRKKSSNYQDLAKKVAKTIECYHAVRPLRIYILKNSSMPKTSSGKIQRLKLAQGIKTGEVEMELVIDNSIGENSKNAPHTNLFKEKSSLKRIEKLAKTVLKLKQEEQLPFDIPLKNLGFDSVHFAELMTQVDQYYRPVKHENAWRSLSLQNTLRDISTFLSIDKQEESAHPPEKFCSRIENIGKIKDYYSSQNNKLKDKVFCNPYESVGADTIVLGGQAYINFGNYNYLGLAGYPEIIQQVKTAIDQYGTSASASRLVAGDRLITKELERVIAKHIGVEEALVYNSGYGTNSSTIACLCGAGDLILYDAYIHNSAFQGISHTEAVRLQYRHNDMNHLEQLMQQAVGQYQNVFILSEGIFSMDGDICDLPRLVEIKQKYGGLLYIDEAHSIGVLGETGAGVCQHFNINATEVDVLMGTLSKSLASCGGYIAGSKTLINFLKFNSEGFIFSAGISPANVAASLGALDVMVNEDWRIKRLHENAEYILEALKSRAIDTGLSKNTPIIPINVGREDTAIQLSLYLHEEGILAAPIIPPAVPDNESRIRLFISALHKEEQLDYTVKKIVEGLEKLG